MERMPESGLPVEPVYDEEQLTNFRPEEKLGKPAAFPYTRGVYPDRFAASYAIESMTSDIEDAALGLMTTVEDMGGAVAAIERGFQQGEIGRAAYDVAREIDAGERAVVGVNKFVSDGEEPCQRPRPTSGRQSKNSSRSRPTAVSYWPVPGRIQ